MRNLKDTSVQLVQISISIDYLSVSIGRLRPNNFRNLISKICVIRS